MSTLFPPEEAGVAFHRRAGVDLIRHYGDPAAEYRAATEGVAVRDRSHRRQWAFTGRQPLEMLSGIVTGHMPRAPEVTELGIRSGSVTYHTVLTPKGKMISDLWLWVERGASKDGANGDGGGSGSGGSEDGPVVRAHLPLGAADGLASHLSRYLPPRLAKRQDRTEGTGMLTVVGPSAARVVSGIVLGLRVEASELEEMAEGDFRLMEDSAADRVLVVRSGQVGVPAFDVIADRGAVRSLWRMITDAGAEPLGLDVWDTLRVEAGRPAWERELSDDVIPVEAGIHDRAIDYVKGCYTGQEVIVRIRDRGRVNRHLRRLVLDVTAGLPEPGTELFREEERPRGAITTAVDSPRRGKLALAYLRREVEPGQTVTVGGPDGPRARVEALE